MDNQTITRLPDMEDFHFLLRCVQLNVEDLTILEGDFTDQLSARVHSGNHLHGALGKDSIDTHGSGYDDSGGWLDVAVDVKASWRSSNLSEIDVSVDIHTDTGGSVYGQVHWQT